MPEVDPLEDRLRALAAREPSPPPALVAATLHQARAELAAYEPAVVARELLRLLAAATPSLVLAILWNVAVVLMGGQLLARFLPAPFVELILGLYLFGVLGWTALVMAAAPALVHHKLARRQREALS